MAETFKKTAKDDANARIDALMLKIDKMQESYMKNKKRFWQGIRTHDAAPSMDTPARPDKKRKATECEAWEEAGIDLPDDMPISMQVDVYDGESGKGYVCIFQAKQNGLTFMRCINHGAETHREKPWHALTGTL
jgi:hypothetical protein